jgi:copper homeostasis protein
VVVGSKHKLEICVDSYQDAMVAIRGGADRLEVCADLHLDGLTPDYDMVARITDHSDIPVMVMIRCRAGNFCYSNEEIDQMIAQIESFKDLKLDGFVWGCLSPNNEIDILACQKMIAACQAFPVTFHRAFDLIKDKELALHKLIDLGFDTILTAGITGNAIEGIDSLTILNTIAGNQISIMPGGGIMPENAKGILDIGVRAIHASLGIKDRSYDSCEKVKRLKALI